MKGVKTKILVQPPDSGTRPRAQAATAAYGTEGLGLDRYPAVALGEAETTVWNIWMHTRKFSLIEQDRGGKTPVFGKMLQILSGVSLYTIKYTVRII